MPAIYATAPGKIILCGEHAVVYGKPAIALPVTQVRTRTSILARPAASPGSVRVIAPCINLDADLSELAEAHPLRKTISLVLQELRVNSLPSCEIRITTDIPLGAGLGSSASVTVSLARALANFLGHPLPDVSINRIAYEIEKIHHGTPSGIDNTVITFGAPILFQKNKRIEFLDVRNGFTLIIADSGSASSTAEVVEGVRLRWQEDSARYDQLFEQIAAVTMRVHGVLCNGSLLKNGALLTENHRLLREIGVSTANLDLMVNAALEAGASGAKLSGGGGGGNIIALVEPGKINAVSAALLSVGVNNIIVTSISGKGEDSHD